MVPLNIKSPIESIEFFLLKHVNKFSEFNKFVFDTYMKLQHAYRCDVPTM